MAEINQLNVDNTVYDIRDSRGYKNIKSESNKNPYDNDYKNVLLDLSIIPVNKNAMIDCVFTTASGNNLVFSFGYHKNAPGTNQSMIKTGITGILPYKSMVLSDDNVVLSFSENISWIQYGYRDFSS